MKNIKLKINDKLEIVDVISKYISLEKSGGNYKGICPFHNDSNPSLVVNEEKKIFKCFVCGEGGTAFDFIQKFENLSYVDCLKKLSKQLQIEYKPERQTKYQEYHDVLKDVTSFYKTLLLKSKQGENVLQYLKNRNISDDTINYFDLGYSPKYNDSLNNFLSTKIDSEEFSTKYSQSTIDELNLFSDKNYDILNNRLIIPIRNDEDQLVGFSGRALENENIKYLNSKDSIIFSKKNLLYNFNNFTKLENKNELLIVEGYFDVITANQNGIKNCVATMGTSFTSNHLQKLKKNKVKKIFLGFDNDAAGNKTTQQIAFLLLENEFEVQIINYSKGKDIDEYFNLEKNSSWNALKKESQDYILYFLKSYNEVDFTIDEKSKLIRKVVEILNLYKDNIKKDILIEEVISILKIERNVLLNNMLISKKKTNISIEDNIPKGSKTLLPNDSEKILFYICANNYDNFIIMKKMISKNEYFFKNYSDDFTKLEMLYKFKKELNVVDIMNEIHSYIKIDNYINKYEIFKNVDVKKLSPYDYVNFNVEKNKSILKLLKKSN